MNTTIRPAQQNAEIRKEKHAAYEKMNQLHKVIEDYIKYVGLDEKKSRSEGMGIAVLDETKLAYAQLNREQISEMEDILKEFNRYRATYIELDSIPNEIVKVDKNDLLTTLAQYDRYYIGNTCYQIDVISDKMILTPNDKRRREKQLSLKELKSVTREVCDGDVERAQTAYDHFTLEYENESVVITAIAVM